ncbi:hypothetical protein DCO46_03220 [Flavobacterium sp. HTF]|nr:hypothetical protein DCO46_03220 [Flavobacterium sp. HTF]
MLFLNRKERKGFFTSKVLLNTKFAKLYETNLCELCVNLCGFAVKNTKHNPKPETNKNLYI